MDVDRTVVWGVVGLVVVTTLVSGPLVGAVDLTSDAETPAYGVGSVTVESASLPERATLTAGRFGAGEYRLQVPDAAVAIAAVEGRPLLVYKLEIDERGYSRSTTHFLSTENVGSYAASMSDDTFAPDTVNQTAYDGRLALVVRANDSGRVVAERSITVEVIE
ncbi:hypothetical protein [Halomicrobium katesii]|uniref:hypothetical protein n=1 Tax=Halomicrobium katesii TaxID=437163 RepID=UPI00036D707D|nr:hypothetical protein [Halomicrobium katesii]